MQGSEVLPYQRKCPKMVRTMLNSVHSSCKQVKSSTKSTTGVSRAQHPIPASTCDAATFFPFEVVYPSLRLIFRAFSRLFFLPFPPTTLIFYSILVLLLCLVDCSSTFARESLLSNANPLLGRRPRGTPYPLELETKPYSKCIW